MAKEGGARRRMRELREQFPEVEEEYQRLAPRYQLLRQLIDARTQAGISQTELARRIGKTQSVIARLESGEHSPKLETIADAARAMGYRLDVQLKRDRSLNSGESATAAS
jgi:ribosome-binding protein aMBF1 (putative translation factor)